ncbi:MAG: hypothetical protein M1820_007011 [Bogoriella megaspora]|nr:MAG: hypothetical protein M1820_007011 [Bogoriella megaspora]
MGLGVFATKDIPAGTLLFSERPLMWFAVDDTVNSDNWNEVLVPNVEACFSNLSFDDKERFLSMRHPNKDHVNFSSKADAFDYNKYQITPPTGDIVHGMYPLASRFNHSCFHNVFQRCLADGPTARIMECSTIAFVSKGEELTTTYIGDSEYMDSELRKCHFDTCLCNFCVNATPTEKTISDMRRRLLAGLRNLQYSSANEIGGEAGMERLMNSNPKKHEWKRLHTHCGKMSLYCTLAAYIAEAEGLNGLFVSEQWRQAARLLVPAGLTRRHALPITTADQLSTLSTYVRTWTTKYMNKAIAHARRSDAAEARDCEAEKDNIAFQVIIMQNSPLYTGSLGRQAHS